MFDLLKLKEIFMKLKYKRLALLTTIATVGIGILVLSIIQERPKAEESLSPASQSVEDDTEGNESFSSDTVNNQENVERGNPKLYPKSYTFTNPNPNPNPNPYI